MQPADPVVYATLAITFSLVTELAVVVSGEASDENDPVIALRTG